MNSFAFLLRQKQANSKRRKKMGNNVYLYEVLSYCEQSDNLEKGFIILCGSCFYEDGEETKSWSIRILSKTGVYQMEN